MQKIVSSCRLLSTAASQTHKQLPGRLLTSKCFKCKKNKQVRTTNHTCTARTLPTFLLDSEQNRALWRQRNSTDLTFSTRCTACRMLGLEGARCTWEEAQLELVSQGVIARMRSTTRSYTFFWRHIYTLCLCATASAALWLWRGHLCP